MPTITDLRELLHDQADQASTAPPPVEAAIRGARQFRAKRRLGVVAGAAAVVAAIVVPTAVQWPSANDEPPPAVQPTARDGRLTSSSGLVWAPTLPGLDLPTGEPMKIPYAFDTTVIDGSVQHELGGVVRRLLEVPEGLVALVDVAPTTPDADGPRQPTRIVLITDDGTRVEQTELDRGYIGSLSSSPPGIGPTRVVWTWTDVSAEANPEEIRAIDLGSPDPPSRVALPDLAFVWTFDGRDPIVEVDPAGGRSFVRWEVDTGSLVPMPESYSSMIAATAGLELLVRFDEATQCTSAVRAGQPDAPLWERCDLLVQTLSPDGKFAVGARFVDGSVDQTADEFAVVDVKTGTDVVALDLPPSGLEFGVPRAPTFQWFVESWEPDGSALVHVLYEGLPGEDPDSNFAPQLRTLARCAVTTGACELVPDAVEVVSTRT